MANFSVYAFNIGKVSGLIEACKHVELAQDKKEFDKELYGICWGYFRGVKDSYDIQKKFGKSEGKICVPGNISWLQLIRNFLIWSEFNRDKYDALAWTGVVNSMMGRYPCD